MIHYREWPPPPGAIYRPDRITATYQNAGKHAPPTSPLSTPDTPVPVTHPRSRQYSPTPRYNSISCCKPWSMYFPTLFSHFRPCKQTCSTPSSTCSPEEAGNVSRSRPPTRRKDSSRKEPRMPSCYISRSPRYKSHLSWRIIASPIACLSAARPENSNTLHHTRV